MSIPYPSGHPFLRYGNRKGRIGRYPVCQSPIHRDTHFYAIYVREKGKLTKMCQSPIHRDTHFYMRTQSRCLTSSMICVNPLSIGTPISTVRRFMSKKKHDKLCQSPIHRDTHFYLLLSILGIMAILCQSPIHWDTHFYPHPENCLILCGLPASILQVFIRQF